MISILDYLFSITVEVFSIYHLMIYFKVEIVYLRLHEAVRVQAKETDYLIIIISYMYINFTYLCMST